PQVMPARMAISLAEAAANPFSLMTSIEAFTSFSRVMRDFSACFPALRSNVIPKSKVTQAPNLISPYADYTSAFWQCKCNQRVTRWNAQCGMATCRNHNKLAAILLQLIADRRALCSKRQGITPNFFARLAVNCPEIPIHCCADEN